MEMIQAVGPPGVLQKVARKSTRLLGPLHPPKEHRSLSLPTIFESDLEPEIQGDGTRSDTLSSEGARDGGLKTQRPRLGAFDADVQTSSTLPLNSIVSKSSGRHSQRSKAKREPHLRDRFASNPSTDSSDPLARAVSLGSSSEMVTQRRQQQQAADSRQLGPPHCLQRQSPRCAPRTLPPLHLRRPSVQSEVSDTISQEVTLEPVADVKRVAFSHKRDRQATGIERPARQCKQKAAVSAVLTEFGEPRARKASGQSDKQLPVTALDPTALADVDIFLDVTRDYTLDTYAAGRNRE